MQPEQQQRIMGYFIEEAKDHLKTIEQGLLNLQGTIEDPEMVNEVFRAAHSIKGGAAMLGIGSIQKTAHRLEDYFKVLKETPGIKSNQNLETLLRQVFDTLQSLLEQLQQPSGLSEAAADATMAAAEPTFEALKQCVVELEQQAAAGKSPRPDITPVAQVNSLPQDNALVMIFQTEVPTQLHEMLQLFQQVEAGTLPAPDARAHLQEICRGLRGLGEAFNLTQWSNLLEGMRQAIASPENSFRILATLVLKEIEQAQDLVLIGREREIVPSEKLQALIPAEVVPEVDQELADFFAIADGAKLTNEFDLVGLDFAAAESADSSLEPVALDLNAIFDLSALEERSSEGVSDLHVSDLQLGELQSSDHQGPEVGMAELNNLADLFEGEVSDLDSTWQEEEVISSASTASVHVLNNSLDLQENGDFADLLFDESAPDQSAAVREDGDLTGLFGDELLEKFNDTPTDSAASVSDFFLPEFDVDEFLELTGQLHENEPSHKGNNSDAADGNENSNSEEDFSGVGFQPESSNGSVADSSNAKLEETDLSLDSLNELFTGLNDDSTFSQSSGDSLAHDGLGANELGPTPNDFDLDGIFGEAIDSISLEEISKSEPLNRLEYTQPATDSHVDDSIDAADDLLLDLVDLTENASSEIEEEIEEYALRSIFADLASVPDPWDDAEQAESVASSSSLENLNSDPTGLDSGPVHQTSLGSTVNSEVDALVEETLNSDSRTSLELSHFDLGKEDAALDDLFAQQDMSDAPELLPDDQELDDLFAQESERWSEASEESSFQLDKIVDSSDASSLDLSEEAGANDRAPLTLNFENESLNCDEEISLDEVLDQADEADLSLFGSDDSDLDVSVTADHLAELFDAEEKLDLDVNGSFEAVGPANGLLAGNPEDLELDVANLLDFSTFEWSDAETLLSQPDRTAEETTQLDRLVSSGSSTEEDLAESADAEIDLSLELNFSEETSLSALDEASRLSEADAQKVSLELSGNSEPAESDINNSDLRQDLNLGDLHLSTEQEDLDNLDTLLSAEEIHDSDDDANPSGLDALFDAGIATESVAGLRAEIAGTQTNSPQEPDTQDTLLNSNVSQETINDANHLEDLDILLEDNSENSSFVTSEDLDNLDALLDVDAFPSEQADLGELDELDSLLHETSTPAAEAATTENFTENFADLESLLADSSELTVLPQTAFAADNEADAEFGDLEKMLEDADKTMGGPPTIKGRGAVSARRPARVSKGLSEPNMRVSVKHLDNLSNLVGELVVNRNSLEQDQERLRQSLDNLLYQVQQLSDVGQRMRDLYERSLLESSLLASRQNHRVPFVSDRDQTTTNETGVEYDPLEMDRFTGFHSLSQEMIELIVRVRESASDIEFVVDETDQVTRMFRQVTTQLQEGLTRSRMVPFAQAADRLPRAVRDIALKCGKQAELVIEGRDTLIDKMILEHLYDPLTHLVNNALTHGIESPELRYASGKPPTGQITIRAFHQGNQTVISVSDDGAGVDVERVRTKAIEKGLITRAEAETLSRLDIYDLLFHPGFSTKDQADDFAGRGVGMDVVQTSLSEIRGVINTDSVQGKGTTFTIRLPLTLSISKALCCISDRARIAFPMDGVEDMLDLPKERVQPNAEGQLCIAWRDNLLPLRPLNDLLAYNRHLSRGTVYGGHQEDDMVSVVVLRSAGNYLALQVDQVLGEQEIVIKQLEGPVPKPIGVAGATVLGDGRIMPIADVLELIDLSMDRIRREVNTMWDQGTAQIASDTMTVKTEPMVLIVDDSITVRELLSMTFNKIGYRVEQARDGQEAWEKLRSGLPCDIVFCDIEMPRMDGLELLSRIQKDPNLSHLPIAMLTSRGADRHRQMAASLGASGYFTKPYLEEALLDAAQRMLKGEVLIGSSAGSNGNS